ncbi:MAG TPA: Ig-like domain-containing protein [Burkholderiaceae bacterium]|nr:Ig-like domain-containing protein [Burkholderiaceae bacterium]
MVWSALDRNDQLASFSSYGDYVDVAAPGVDIWTTDIGGGYIGVPGGTSYASPITAGVLALMMSANPELLPQDLEQLLFASAQDLGAAGFDPQYGHGRVDAAAAVQAALNATPSQGPERVPPVVTITQPAAYSTVSDYAMVHIDATDNVGVTRVELKANDRVVAIDYVAPYELAWYTPSSPDGIVELVAYAYDEAGNVGVSTAVPVNVANPVIPPPDTDTTAPEISIVNPVEGAVSGQVNITVNATDNSGAANISLALYIDNVLYASGNGSTLSVVWNTRPKRVSAGTHTLRVDARDAAGNPSSASVVVDVVKSRGGAKR